MDGILFITQWPGHRAALVTGEVDDAGNLAQRGLPPITLTIYVVVGEASRLPTCSQRNTPRSGWRILFFM